MSKRAESFSEFLTLVDLQKCTVVVVAPYEMAISQAKYSAVSGEAREFALGVLYTATGRWPRKVVYFEHLMDRVRTERGRVEGSSQQELDSLMCFVTADERAEHLRLRRPDLTVGLKIAEGTLSDQEREELLDDARHMHIKPIKRADA